MTLRQFLNAASLEFAPSGVSGDRNCQSRMVQATLTKMSLAVGAPSQFCRNWCWRNRESTGCSQHSLIRR